MSISLTISVDSDAFIALAREDDANHNKALSCLAYLMKHPVQFVTSNYVVSESITVISIRKSHEAAIEFITTMQSAENVYVIKRVDETVEKTAIDIFKHQTSKNTSFVDCTNMAFMRALRADAIFSFNQVYRKNGFKLVSDLMKEKN